MLIAYIYRLYLSTTEFNSEKYYTEGDSVILLFTILCAFIIIYLYNWYLIRILIKYESLTDCIKFLTPLVEESVKTSFAVVTDTSILFVHVGVGTVEGVIDLLYNNKVSTMLAAVLGHGIFGLVTQLLFEVTGYVLVGWLIATVLHCLWNYLILSIPEKDK